MGTLDFFRKRTENIKEPKEKHRVLQGDTMDYKTLQGVTGGSGGLKDGYKFLQEVLGGYRGLQGVTRGFRGLQGVTSDHRA